MKYKFVPVSDENLIARSSGQVTNPSDFRLDYAKITPIKGGLFDGSIFGSINKCSCGYETKIGSTCPLCKDKVVNTDGANRRVGHYVLGLPIISKYKVKLLYSKLSEFPELNKMAGKDLFSIYNNYIDYIKVDDDNTLDPRNNLYVKDLVGDTYKVTVSHFNTDLLANTSIFKFGPIALRDLVKNYRLHPVHAKSLDFVNDFFNQCIIITPTTTRRVVFIDGVPNFDRFNTYYRAIIKYDELMKKLVSDESSYAIQDKLAIYYSLNNLVNLLYDEYPMLATSKQNMIRNKLIKRVGESGRANIIGAPDLKVDEVYLPRSLVYEAGKVKIINEIKKNPEVRRPIDEYNDPTRETIEMFEKLVSTWGVLMLRNPSLQKYNISAFKIRLWDKAAIGLPSLSVDLFNADFDGDQMAFFLLTNPDTVGYYVNLMGPNNNWFFEKNNEPIFAPQAAVLEGCYIATLVKKYEGNKYFESKEDVFKAYEQDMSIEIDELVDLYGEQVTYGRLKVGEILGFNIDDVLEASGDNNPKITPLSVKNISYIMMALNSKDNKTERLRDLQQFALEAVTFQGTTTVSLRDIYQTDTNSQEFDAILNSNEPDSIKYRHLNEISNAVIKRQVSEFSDDNLKNITKGSGKLKAASMGALFGPRFELDRSGELKFYDNSLSKGYSEESYVSHTIENREILIQKQKLIPSSGYFSRQLVGILYDVLYTEDPSISTIGAIIEESKAKGRVVIEKLGKDENGETLVRVKSSIDGAEDRISKEEISTESRGIQNYKEGQAIGISMATSFAEPTTQAALGLKHGGSIWRPSKESIKIIKDGVVTEVTNNFITTNNEDGSVSMYYRPKSVILTEAINGSHIKKGTVLAYEDRLIHVEYQLSQLFRLLGAYVTPDKDRKVKKEDITSNICYSPVDGTISYEPTKNRFRIGSFVGYLDPNTIYYYPEGYKLVTGQRFCSGLINLLEFERITKDLGWTYYVCKKQIEEIIKSNEINSELLEAIFKVIHSNNYSIRTSHKKLGKLFNEINLSHAKRAIENTLSRDDIGDGLLTRLLMRD